MSSAVYFNPQDPTVAGRVTKYDPPGTDDTPPTDPNSISNPDLSQVQNTPQQYWKVYPPQVGGQVIPMIPSEQAAWDAKVAADLLALQRAQAEADVISPQDIGKLERGAVDIIIQEFNKHKTYEDGFSSATSTWITNFLAAVAAASSLADLKTRIAGLAAFSPPSPIATATLPGAKTGIISDIAAGGEGD